MARSSEELWERAKARQRERQEQLENPDQGNLSQATRESVRIPEDGKEGPVGGMMPRVPGSAMAARPPMGAQAMPGQPQGMPGQGLPVRPGMPGPQGPGILPVRPGGPAPAGIGAERPPLPGMNGAQEAEEFRPRKGITEEDLQKARQTLNKYRAGKASVERRVIAAEEWWKLRQWRDQAMAGAGNPEDPRPASAWLFNVLMGKHADAVEAYPEPDVLPREESDRGEAQMLANVIPVILEQNGFEETYDHCAWQKMKTGTAVYGVFWDGSLENGLGDVAIRRQDLLNLFWEPGIDDIQKSRNLFHTAMVDDEALKEQYPQLKDKPLSKSLTVSKFIYDDNVDTSGKSIVVDWYYKRIVNGKTVLHFCKFVGNEILYATENDPERAEKGWYDDGQYPFVFDALFPVEGSPAGYGYIDIGRGAQEDIDRMNQAIVKNSLMASHPRFFVRSDGSVNEEEFADWTRPLVHVNGNLGQDSIRQIDINPLSGTYVSILNNKIEELKYTSGNMDVQNGGTSGATAASAIAAQMEAAGRSSRASTKASYRAYGRVINMVIERIRQFYDVPRTFRIVGEMGMERYVQYSNAGIKPQEQGTAFGIELGQRRPVFDIRVAPQKQNAYTKAAQNDMALLLYNAGFFNPQLSDQALMALEMMDFYGKDELREKVAKQGTMAQQLALYQKMALMLAAKYEPQLAEGLAAQITGQGGPVPMGAAPAAMPEEVRAEEGGSHREGKHMENARKMANAAGQPE